MTTPAVSPIPGDAPTPRKISHALATGKSIAIHTLGIGGLFRLVQVADEIGIITVPEAYDITAFADESQRAQLDAWGSELQTLVRSIEDAKASGDVEAAKGYRAAAAAILRTKIDSIERWNREAPIGVKRAIEDSVKRRVAGYIHYLLGFEPMAYALLGAVTDQSEADLKTMGASGELQPFDVLSIVNKAYDLIPIGPTVEAALGFFSRIMGLMGEYGGRLPDFTGKERPATEESETPS
jgi:hypothetical protein